MNSAIATGLGLGGLQSAVIQGSVPFQNKVHVLKTLVDLSVVEKARQKSYTKLITAIADESKVRNIPAHYPFDVSSDGLGVEFIVISAKGKLLFPETTWYPQLVIDKCCQLEAWATKVDALRAELASSRIIFEFLRESPSPTQIQALLSALYFQAPPPQESPG